MKKKTYAVSEADIDKAILKAQYHRFKGTTLTVCCLTLTNGFTVTGNSACVDPENYDTKLGRKIAFNAARSQIWPLLGYECQTRFKRSQQRRTTRGRK